jgi:hypothetical protein
MVGSRLLAVLLALAALVAAQDAPAQGQADWHTMPGPNRSFTADLPASPKYTATQMKTGSGAAYTMHQYITEVGDIAFVVQTTIYPADIDVSKPRVILQGGLDNSVKNMDGRQWASADWSTHQGFSAVDATGTRDGYAVRLFSTMKGRQIVSLTYVGRRDQSARRTRIGLSRRCAWDRNQPKQAGQRQRVCQGVMPPLPVNLPSLIDCSVPSMRAFAMALMRPSDPMSIVNLRVWFRVGKCTTRSSIPPVPVLACCTSLVSRRSPNSRSCITLPPRTT